MMQQMHKGQGGNSYTPGVKENQYGQEQAIKLPNRLPKKIQVTKNRIRGDSTNWWKVSK